MAIQVPLESVRQAHAVGRRHRTGLVTLLFTDMAGSTALKQRLGDGPAAQLFQKHHELIRTTLQEFPQAEEIETAGDSFLLVFATPSDAVHFALLVQNRLRKVPLLVENGALDRIGIHVGEVVLSQSPESGRPADLFGIQIDTCARVMSLANPGQVLMTRSVFDSARQALKGEDTGALGTLEWLNHGLYLLKGLDEALEVCEVHEADHATAGRPENSDKAHRQLSSNESVLGWRPAVGQGIPQTKWRLERKLGEGGFGEVWLGRNSTTRQPRVFKFCFQAERVRFLKRELTLFRVLKERVGDHPNLVRILDVNLDHPPFYVEMEYVEGADLRSWLEQQGGPAQVSLEKRLQIVAQAADGLEAAHRAGIVHRDIKPANILIGSRAGEALEAKLTDFGIGQVVSEEYLSGITRAGFTQTMVADSSSSRTGTQLYMAPELLAGKPASTRSDIYSLGVVLYQLLAGDLSRPLTTDWTEAVAEPLLREDLLLCLAGNPEQRFSTASELAARLRAFPERQRVRAEEQRKLAARERAAYRRGVIRTAAAAAVLVMVVGGLGLYAWNESRQARAQAHRAERERQVASRYVYDADMVLAFDALEASNLGYARKLMSRHVPAPGQKQDFRGWEWRYLWEQCRGDEIMSFQHESGATVASFFPDGRTVASTSKDRTVKLWNVTSRSLIATLPHSGGVHGLAIAPDGLRLAAGCDDGIVTVWNVAARTPERTFTNLSDVNALVYSPDGALLAWAGERQAQVWQLTGKQPLLTVDGALGPMGFKTGLAISPDSRFLALGHRDGRIELRDLKSGGAARLLATQEDQAISLAFSPDGHFLASGGSNRDHNAHIWEIATAREVARLTNFVHWVGWLAFSPDGQTLATAGGDQMIRLWSTKGWEQLASLQGHEFEVWSVAFSPDGRTLVTASKDRTVKVWDSAVRRKNNLRTGVFEGTVGAGFSPDHVGVVRLFPHDTFDVISLATTDQSERRSLGETGEIRSLALSSDRRWIGLVKATGAVQVHDCSTGRLAFELDPVADQIYRLEFTPDSQTLVGTADHRQVYLWDLFSRHVRRSFQLRPQDWTRRITPDSRKLAVGYYDATVELWDLQTGAKDTISTGHEERIMALAFSADSRTLATSSVDVHLVKLWDLSTHTQFAELGGQLAVFGALAFSPDGRRLAAGGSDGSVTLWDLEDRAPREVAKMRAHSGSVDDVTFSPDGNTLISSGADGQRVWAAPAGMPTSAAASSVREDRN